MLQGSEQLLTIAEIGATLAGFTAIVGILARSDRSNIRSRTFFWLMIEFSFATMLFSLLPFAVSNFEIVEPLVWAASSFVMAAFIIAHFLVVSSLVRSSAVRGQFPRFGPAIVVPLFVLILLIQLLNTIGVVFERTYAGYFLGLILFLGLALLSFVLLLHQLSASNEKSGT